MIENTVFKLSVGDIGQVTQLEMKTDPYQMNWVIEENYLQRAGFADGEKLFGHFDLVSNGQHYLSSELNPVIQQEARTIKVSYDFTPLLVEMTYDLAQTAEDLVWQIKVTNQSDVEQQVTDFGVWASFAYVMFRDKNVLRNIHDSAAVFPAVSTNYTKLNVVRRDNQGGNLGVYQTKGETLSVGTFCEYENLFFENVSPSLDGLLFHKLILAGGYPTEKNDRDWIYSKAAFTLAVGETKTWEYTMNVNYDQEEFLAKGNQLGHARIDYPPLNILGEPIHFSVETTTGQQLQSVKVNYQTAAPQTIDLSSEIVTGQRKQRFTFLPAALGEHQVTLTFADGTEDFVVFNVMDPIDEVIAERVAYICEKLYTGAEGKVPYAFEPISNQGESLGKLNLVLKKNLMGELDIQQVRLVEESAVKYVREKWFIDGDFTQPAKLYGDFYRCMDFEYIGHLFYLLSEFDDADLALNDAQTYLSWAADVFNLRVNPDLHDNERGKEEAQMLGVYFLYITELLQKLAKNGLTEKYQTIQGLWEQVTKRVANEADTYKAAITEHFYDNAGFGPTAGALSEMGMTAETQQYGELLLANIGYSNDFRAQNPDRWWEALTYMIHSLWGGVTAAATFKVYELLKDPAYLAASYRATAGILYCYDTHSSTTLSLEKGMAASTYAVAGPHLNRPDLSRERFGQATFYRDGGIFARLFENDSQTPDWDMGEELVAYLDSFGKKTFIVKDGDQIKVINGSYEIADDKYTITSFAPYSQEFYFVEGQNCQLIQTPSTGKQLNLSRELLEKGNLKGSQL